MTRKAVILAAGLGRRMRHRKGVTLTPEQEAMADAGLKCLIPVGRPFLDYCLSALAEAGIREVCLVVGARSEAVRAHCAALDTRRLELAFVVQDEPKGTADALLAAAESTGAEPFLMLNSDNHYGVEVLRDLSALEEPGLVVFRRDGLVASERSNITSERVRGYAIAQSDEAGYLTGLLEKPDLATLEALQDPVFVSLNCWRFSSEIYEACRSIEPSARGELELTAAVEWSRLHQGVRFRVLVSDQPVLDLSQRLDIPVITRLLRDEEVRLS